jgi:hypothetical protein
MLSSVIEEERETVLQKEKRDQCHFYYSTDSFTEQSEKKN